MPEKKSTEEWRPVDGYPYQVSSRGRVRRNGARKCLKLSIDANGYRLVGPSRHGKQRSMKVHQIVLRAFAEPRPPGAITRHLDGNPSNNCIENLKWGTMKENAADRKRHGTQVVGLMHHSARVTPAQVREMRARWATQETLDSIAKDYPLSRASVWDAVTRRSWAHVE